MAEEIVGGIHAVTAALRHDPLGVLELWVDRQRHDGKLQSLLSDAEQNGISVQEVPRKTLDGMARGLRHQGVVARCKQRVTTLDESALNQLLDGLEAPPFLLILDGVTDPHNLGACLRSADAAGIHAVIAPKDRAVGLTPVARKVACGAAESVPFVQVTNLARTLRALQDRGVWLIGAAGETKHQLYSTDLKGPLAVVMGAEEKGLRRITREVCDLLVAIPMQGSVESLNVSVATGVLLFEARRQRDAIA
ncbi:23S rRNA (guanosine(2251)-2'-O)-methyltransferase RlmB [Solemya pervernicosa gill symbiont]|uniref:23S rRNA (guanosine-2'-O-)-methyltransferase RlmB n=2 Tax=Gammaproteobacteria incertae sedis TaxID=118884 RepID=A0A1T2L7L6_9GAMM|nr:23S rRNA (guanosine(2251)-2'-O)-methyltransferase RlmB [Candidatus Reidiella endopervernicosa]OOZ41099.1 23S rRNA (guanosine(2251)-2'-O)-methyltransferase RlmB [Solemya pervernicosa gill symbiont]QKQ26261.1 23S rRNA (guanosine(2251)-2'-O)-methyltransferase RlmB [Candidatus Reidiella endopervernicosa]